jgi:hypothetical protein
MERTRINLNGTWSWTRRGHQPTTKLVPSSYQPVGSALFERDFTLEHTDGQWILVFEGITYSSTVKVNGKSVGETMLPYSHYEIDVTKAVKAGANHLVVTVEDSQVPFGPNFGWESYGGIIRDVYLEQRNSFHIAHAHFQTTLRDAYSSADCSLSLQLSKSAPRGASARIKLTECDTAITTVLTEFPVDGRSAKLTWSLEHPRLWSPETPMLYMLEVELKVGGETDDIWRHRVGFRDIRCIGTHFEVNGVRTFMKGVARHDMWLNQGFTLTREQMRQDMTLIKEMGCNFVRLVHYPNHPYMLDLADEIGIIVTGESGIWWHDLNNPALTEPALQILERLVRRDINHPSIMGWLLGNESTLRQPFLKDGAARIRAIDPDRFVSFANCDSNEHTKEHFNEAGLDFYTQHPYSFEPDKAIAAMKVLNDKPLIFTEWGAMFVRYNEQGFNEFKKVAVDGWRTGKLAGMSYWEWADMRQYMRGHPGCAKGVLWEGLVEENRVKRPMYGWMQQLFRELDHDEPGLLLDPPERFAPVVQADPAAEFAPVSLEKYVVDSSQAAIWERVAAAGKKQAGRWLLPTLRDEHFPGGPKVGPIPFTLSTNGLPICLDNVIHKISIPINAEARRLHLLGQVTAVDGFPTKGTWGDTVAQYRIGVKGGKAIIRSLKLGEDVVRGDLMWAASASRMDPRPANGDVVLRWWLHTETGYYQVCLLTIDLGSKPIHVRALDFELLDGESMPMLYAVTVEA